MAQNYKVYFSNRLMIFTDVIPDDIRPGKGVAIHKSSGMSDVLNTELAIAKGAKVIYILCEDVESSWSRFRSQFEFVQAAGGLVINAKGQFLFIFRKSKWDLPKGKVEEGEDLMQGAIREVEEECSIYNLEIEKPLVSTWHTYVQDSLPMLKNTAWFLMKYSGDATPIPQAIEGITEVRWVNKEDLKIPAANTYPSVMEVVKDYAGYEMDS